MSPKGARHEIVKIELNEHLQRVKPSDIRIAQETTLRLDEKNFVEPDFCVFSRSVSPGDMRGPDVLLAIEIADTSLAYDRGRKIGIYAAFGIAEIWVIDANRLATHIYRELGAQGYGSITMASASDTLEARRAPSVRVNLAELGLKPLVRRR